MIWLTMYGEDNVTDFKKTVENITVDDIKAAAKVIFRSGNRIEVGMTSPVE